MPERPVGTQLVISEGYVSELETQAEEKDKMVERWKKYLGHCIDLLEILRDRYDNFDKVLKNFNDTVEDVQIVVTPEETIKFKINAQSQEG